ncbi:hypothetical protein K438DRAFT_569338 [Mycena galopus ATCC 62051]|nr:hypothetical protein K438DRAFT_569338 [Mycena galopus ATCC 62051]
MEVYMDKVFAAATKTTTHKKDDKPYKPPRKKPALSEESDNDFNIDDLYEPATPAGRRKRELVVIDSDDELAPTPSSEKIAGAALQETVPGPPILPPKAKMLPPTEKPLPSLLPRRKRRPRLLPALRKSAS